MLLRFSTDFSFQAKSISDTSRRPFNASGGVTALLLNNPNNNLENFDKCPVACGYATKVSKVTHSPSIAVKGKCQSRVNTLMHNEISDHLFFAGKQERYARRQNTLSNPPLFVQKLNLNVSWFL